MARSYFMKKISFWIRVSILLFFSLSCFANHPNALVQAKRKQVKAFVNRAVQYVLKHGQVAAFKAFDNPRGSFRKGNLYIFASYYMGYGQGLIVASGTEGYVGKDFYKERTRQGKPIMQAMKEKALQGGGWVSYKWVNPTTHKREMKHSYVMSVPRHMFLLGAGYYDSEVSQ